MEDIQAQFQRMHENGLDCTSVRYLGSVGQSQFVFVLRHGQKDVWYVSRFQRRPNNRQG